MRLLEKQSAIGFDVKKFLFTGKNCPNDQKWWRSKIVLFENEKNLRSEKSHQLNCASREQNVSNIIKHNSIVESLENW